MKEKKKVVLGQFFTKETLWLKKHIKEFIESSQTKIVYDPFAGAGHLLNTAKEILAFELTKLVHGEEEAKKADEAAKALFSGQNAENMPKAVLTAEDFTDGNIDILAVLQKSGLVPSRSEGRRAVEQGGVTVEGEKVTDIKTTYGKDAFEGEGLVVKRGKKNFKRVVVE